MSVGDINFQLYYLNSEFINYGYIFEVMLTQLKKNKEFIIDIHRELIPIYIYKQYNEYLFSFEYLLQFHV